MATVTVQNIHGTGGQTQQTTVAATAATPTDGLVQWSIGTTVVVIIVWIVMWFIFRGVKPHPILASAGYVPFVGIVAIAAGLERLLQPLTSVKDSDDNSPKKTAANSKKAAEAVAADPAKDTQATQNAAQAAADAQAVSDQFSSKRAVIMWGIASVLGLVISGGFGFFMLQSVSTNHVNTFLDLGVTGLTIGAGTKPLHDWITTVQAKSSSS